MAKEVFCKNCDFYVDDPDFRYPPEKNTGTDIHSVCICPYNIDENYDPKDPHKFISCPSIINRYHDCNWFRVAQKLNTYVWSQSDKVPKYKAHGAGTFNINPKDGADGFYIGEKTLSQIIKEQGSSGDDVKTEIEELKKTDKQIKDDLIQLNQDVIDVNENLTDLYENIVTPLVKQVQTVKFKVESHDRKITEYDSKIQEQDQKISTMEDTIEQSTQTLQQLKEEVSSALEVVEDLQNEVEETLDDIQDMDYRKITEINCGSSI